MNKRHRLIQASYLYSYFINTLRKTNSASSVSKRLLFRNACVILAFVWISSLACGCWTAVSMCTPCPTRTATNNHDHERRRPLVEYYVHGRGKGHYMRSVAVVDRLRQAGVDVRIFLTPETLQWQTHFATATTTTTNNYAAATTMGGEHALGTIQVVETMDLLPTFNKWKNLRNVVTRLFHDCRVSQRYGHPDLIVTDGDFSGMFRAKIGGIPSVSIAHGLLFPIMMSYDDDMERRWRVARRYKNKWNVEYTKNHVASFFSTTLIATNFCPLEIDHNHNNSTSGGGHGHPRGIVASPPLRPEVLRLAAARRLATEPSQAPFLNFEQASQVRQLLGYDKAKEEDDDGMSSSSVSDSLRRRKLVICYFRDGNGKMAVQSMLDAGFDVVVFHTKVGEQQRAVPQPETSSGRLSKPLTYLRRPPQDLSDQNSPNGRTVLRIDPTSNSSLPQEDLNTSHEATTTAAAGPRLIQVTDHYLFMPFMHVADGVVASAGSQLMSECIYAKVPLLALYVEGDVEQEWNVEMTQQDDDRCHTPFVFGMSFDDLPKSSDRARHVVASSPDEDRQAGLPEAFGRFVQNVQGSIVSQTHYEHWYGQKDGWKANTSSTLDLCSFLDEEPFQGLPDAVEILHGKIKQLYRGHYDGEIKPLKNGCDASV